MDIKHSNTTSCQTELLKSLHQQEYLNVLKIPLYIWSTFSFSFQFLHFHKLTIQQECIPVGCIPSAALSIGRGGCLPGGCVCSGGVYLSMHWAGGCLLQCMLGYTLPPVDRILDTHLWKHYLSATTLRTVKLNSGCYICLRLSPGFLVWRDGCRQYVIRYVIVTGYLIRHLTERQLSKRQAHCL